MTTPKQPPLDAPDDQWLVYADALQEAGDPRGELIALNQKVTGGADPKDRDAFVQQHAAELLGPAAEYFGAYQLDWRRCVLEMAAVRVGPQDDAAAMTRALLASPAAEGLWKLSLVGVPSGSHDAIDLSGAVAEVVKAMPESCRYVALVDDKANKSQSLISRDYDPGENLVQFGPLTELVALSGLERLHIVTADPHQLDFEGLDAPGLRSFTLHGLRFAESYDAPSQIATQLASIKWPKLEDFEARLAETWTCSVPDETGAYVAVYAEMDEDESYYDEYDDDGWNEGVNYTEELAGLMESLKQTPLKRLALTSFDSSGQLLEALRSHGLPETLEELDLSESSLGAEAVQFFLDNKELFGKLKRLVLEDTLIGDDDAKKLADLGPEIEHSEGSGACYRFLVGME
jgi:uncharacterized protein (TIGR02996 family)